MILFPCLQLRGFGGGDLWTSAVSLCEPSSPGSRTGGEYWWAWTAPVNPYSPDQREGEGTGGESGRCDTKEISKQKESRGKVKEVERNTVRLSSTCCHRFNRRLRPLLTPTGVAKRLVTLQYNGRL
ncbi:unnamed protein product [Pleuronectes platessa]|uniref:Uncharacterized protein n=1 Tax=Pleuronectes platessa TaxID=8262 RepID=A0A9N7Y8W3_PLEPL|nr:unnamed protein product [Pleuronectes platessa]